MAARAVWGIIAILALVAPAQRASADVLMVTTKGTIAPVCSVSVKSPIPSADFTSSGHVSGLALLNCNTGFVMTATSANGGLKNDVPAPRGFTNSLGYFLSVFISLGGAAAVSGGCTSARLVAGNSSCSLSPGGAGLSSGGKPAIGTTAYLTVIWATPTKPHLVAGAYHDTITISVAAAP